MLKKWLEGLFELDENFLLFCEQITQYIQKLTGITNFVFAKIVILFSAIFGILEWEGRDTLFWLLYGAGMEVITKVIIIIISVPDV